MDGAIYLIFNGSNNELDFVVLKTELITLNAM